MSFFLNAQIIKLDQFISFDPISDRNCSDTIFNISASVNSGLSITFNIVSGPATISGNNVILLPIDFRHKSSQITIIIKASQGGNEFYNEATDVSESFNVKTNFIDSLTQKPLGGNTDTTLFAGDSIKLNAKKITGLVYKWTIPTLEVYLGPEVVIPHATTLLSGIYSLTISNGACKLFSSSFKINIQIKPDIFIKEDSSIYVYKIITPNQDQKNDYLFIKNIDKYADHKLSIFDLWGNMVFQSTNYQKEWPSNNTVSGEYYYSLIISATGKTYTGGILVLKE
jgi:gliding motility-associated-like protein